jgi:hypothetical protein
MFTHTHNHTHMGTSALAHTDTHTHTHTHFATHTTEHYITAYHLLLLRVLPLQQPILGSGVTYVVLTLHPHHTDS